MTTIEQFQKNLLTQLHLDAYIDTTGLILK